MFEIFMPVNIYFGCGEIKRLSNICKAYGERLCLITDPFLKDSELKKNIIRQLELEGKKVIEFYDIVSNPVNTDIDKCAQLVIKEKCEFVVAIGGGSTIDTAKAVAVVATNGGKCWDYCYQIIEEGQVPVYGFSKLPEKKPLPVIAVPTTAGTGSEVTPFSVINNPALKLKSAIVNKAIFPAVAIVDPELMLSKTPMLTALTGMDVFSHAFESYTSLKASPYSEIIALKSLKLFSKSVENAVKNGKNIEARKEMALSSLYAGMAIAHTGTTLPHAIGLALSAFFNANHGGSLTACLPEIIEWTLPVCEDKIARVAEILDPLIENMSTSEKARKLPVILENLMLRIGVSFPFSHYGMKDKDIPVVCDLVFKMLQGDIKYYPKLASMDDLKGLIKKCMY